MGCGASKTNESADTAERGRSNSVDLESSHLDEISPSEFGANSRLRRRSMAVLSPQSVTNFSKTKFIAQGLIGTTSKGKFTVPVPDPSLSVNFAPRSDSRSGGGSPSSNGLQRIGTGTSSVSQKMRNRHKSNCDDSSSRSERKPDHKQATEDEKPVKLPCAIKEIGADSSIIQLALECMLADDPDSTESWVAILVEVERQQQLLMRVTNPSIVETLGVAISGSVLRVATMYSVPLDEVDYAAFTANDIRGVLKDVLTGVVGLHSHGLVHGNIKVGNLLGSHEESNMNEFLIVDGGYQPIFNRVSKRALYDNANQKGQGHYPPECLTRDGAIDKPPAKMAEQVDQQKGDMWAVGVMAYELVFGKPPFLEGDNADSTFRRIREHNVEVPMDYTRGKITVSAQLGDLILSLLDKDPARRPSAVNALRHPLFHRGKDTEGRSLRDTSHIHDRTSHQQVQQVHDADFSAMSTRAMSMLDFRDANGTNDGTANVTGMNGSRTKPTQQENMVADPSAQADETSRGTSMSEDDRPLTGFQHPLGDDDDDIVVISEDLPCALCRGPLPPVAYRCTHTSCRTFVICSPCYRTGVDPSKHDPEHPMSTVIVEEMDERKMSVALGAEMGLSILNRSSPQADPHLEIDMVSEAGSCHSMSTPQPYSLDVHPQHGGLAGGGGAGAGAVAPPPPADSMSNLVAPIPSKQKSSGKFSVLVSSHTLTTHEQTIFGMTGQLPESKLDVAKKPGQGKCSLMSGFTQSGGAAGAKEEGVADDGFTVEDVMTECRGGKADMNFHAMYLTKVPLSTYDPPLPHIIELDLSSNEIKSLPHEISFLQSLQKLLLGNNKLTELPDSIGDLSDLEILEAHHNLLEEIPQQLMFAEKLQTLSLDYNNLTSFPEVCFAMERLSTLYLASNLHITKWPALEDLKQLPDIQIGLDNQPHLFSRYNMMQDKLPNIRVLWHKIYPDSIIPNLYCGSLRSAQTPLVYEALKIRHILTMGRGLEPYVEEGMRQKGIMVDDIPGANIEETFEEAIEFIDVALKQGEGCLVHCFAGMSRSASGCIAYLMMKRGMRLDEAYVTVKRGRPAIYPNSGFFQQMLALDAKLYPNSRALDMDSMERDNVPLS